MALSFRFLWAMFSGLFLPKVPPGGPVTRAFRVIPFLDCETGVTLNAARYFTFAEIVQNECNLRCGFTLPGMKAGYWAITLSNTMTYRRSFKRFQKVFVTAELIGWDDRYYVWQNTFRNQKGETYAIGFSKVSVRSKDGIVPVSEVFRFIGAENVVRHLRKDVDALFDSLGAIAKSVWDDPSLNEKP